MTRGFAAIGLCQPKWVENVGGVFRAAHNFGASLVCIEGKRFEKQASDTPKTWRHTPFVRGDDLMALCPYGAVPVAVELCEGATDLFDFIHPERAFYIFGPEDSGVPKRILERVKHRVMVPTRQCMNLAATVTVVLYDRAAKGAHQ